METVKVKNESPSSPEFAVKAVLMLNVYGDTKAVPYTIGFIDSDEKYIPLYGHTSIRFASDYFDDTREATFMNGVKWDDLLAKLDDYLIMVSTLTQSVAGTGKDYKETASIYELPPAVQAERLRLLKQQAIQAEAGWNYLGSKGGDMQTGALLSAIDAAATAQGVDMVIVQQFAGFDLIDINK